jgi:PAS domain S-box-containing protein
VTHDDSHILAANQAASTLLGYDRDELVGLDISAVRISRASFAEIPALVILIWPV